jgi:hypothetical protein
MVQTAPPDGPLNVAWRYQAFQRNSTMADDLSNRGPQDRNRINTSEDWELRYWTKEFGVTEDQLKAAVKAVGPVADDVRRHLKK